MRPSFARATFRAASSLVSRSQSRGSGFSAGRTCSTSAVSNDPIIKHSTISSVSVSDGFKASNASSTHSEQHICSANTLSSGPSVHDSAADESTSDILSSSNAKSSSSPLNVNTESASNGAAVASPESSRVASTNSSDSPFPSAENNTTIDSSTMINTVTSSVASDASQGPVSVGQPSSSVVDGSEFAVSDRPRRGKEFPTPSSDPKVLVTEIQSYLRRNAVRSALFHFISALKAHGSPGVDPSVLKTILPVLGRYGWAPTSLDAVNLALSRGYNLEAGFYNCALHAMARSGDFETIQSVIKRMWMLPAESRPNATSYNYLIGSFMYRGAVDRAFDVLNDMKSHLIYPTFATYHSLISGCLRSNDPRRAFVTLNAVERQRFDIGAMTISQVLVACADADLSAEVLQLIPRLEEAMPLYAQEVHRIAEKRNAYRMTFESRTTPEERAEVRGTPRLELGAISAILHCAFRNCRADLATAGWSLMCKNYPDMHIPPTLWYCVIGALAGSGDFGKAFEVLGVMRENGYSTRIKDLDAALVRPLSLEISKIDEQYYRLCDKAKSNATDDKDLLDGKSSETSPAEDFAEGLHTIADSTSGRNSDGSVSSKLDNVIRSEGLASEENNQKTITTIGNVDADESLRDILADGEAVGMTGSEWKKMNAKSVGIDEINCVIAACSLAGDLDRAFQTYDEVERVFGLEKNLETYNALLEGCVQVKHVRGGLRIVSEMEKLGHKLEGETLQMVVRLMTRGGRAAECIDLLKNVKNNGGEIMLQTYLLLLRYYLRGESMENAAEVYRLGEEDGYEGRTLKGRFDSDTTRKLNTALGVETHDGSSESEATYETRLEASEDRVDDNDLITSEDEGQPKEVK